MVSKAFSVLLKFSLGTLILSARLLDCLPIIRDILVLNGLMISIFFRDEVIAVLFFYDFLYVALLIFIFELG